MDNIKRRLVIDLPERQSAFLWGPRKSGKSTWLRQTFPTSTRYDFLNTDLFLRFSKQPFLLREELLAASDETLKEPVILDEVQKVPAVLDEVHWLIENKGIRFILCGSSARKLKRGHANLLGGRAWRFEMLPLTSQEIGEVDLLKVVNSGLLPPHYFGQQSHRSLKAYIEDYLTQEIMAEGLVRNLPSFARFLDAMGYSQGELTNFTNIARECGVDAKTVRSYYEILEDTLLGRFVPPYVGKAGRQSITSAEKFYLCDVGVAGTLSHRSIQECKGDQFGKAFEHFILMELWAHRAYTEKDYAVRFWRTKAGYEVDFILGDGEVALEVKGSSRVDSSELKAIRAFAAERSPRKCIVVCNETRPRQHDNITLLPWRDFLEQLWAGQII
jgi:predicted AAA+ superfamily ATPase